MVSGLVTSRRVCLSQSGGRKPLMHATRARPQRHDEAEGAMAAKERVDRPQKNRGTDSPVSASLRRPAPVQRFWTWARHGIAELLRDGAATSRSWSTRPRVRTFLSAAAWLNVPEARTGIRRLRTLTRHEESAILVGFHVEYPATRVSR